MNKLRLYVAAASISAILAAGVCAAAEHPGKPVTAKVVTESIMEHVKSLSEATGGVFVIRDDKLNKGWKLNFDKIHDPVRTFEKDGKTIYFTSSDFKSTDGKDHLGIEFWMVEKNGKLEVINTQIYKVNGEPRQTYDYDGIEIKEIK